MDCSAVNDRLVSLATTNPVDAIADLSDIIQTVDTDALKWDASGLLKTIVNNVLASGISSEALCDLLEKVVPNMTSGSSTNDSITMSELQMLLDAKSGNDTVRGNKQDNIIWGEAGSDVLWGGDGNDSLSGGAGNDTYRFGKGDGQDLISDYDSLSGNQDVMQLDGIASDQLWFSKNGNNLDIAVIGSSDKVSIQNWYSGQAYHVEQFKTADGKTLLDSQVQALVSAMASLTPPAAGQTTLPDSYQSTLSPVLAANWK